MIRGKLKAKFQKLGITDKMVDDCKLPFQAEPEDLVDAGLDYYGRKQKLASKANEAWINMRSAAKNEGLDIQIVSGFRSIEYQCNLITSKLEKGETIQQILRVNAIPGYSEHHTGRAVDLHAGQGKPLDETFEKEPAFFWLVQSAKKFNFFLSYPKDNDKGVIYEPWHWCYRN